MSDQFKQLSIFETTVLHNQFGKTDAINASLKKSILKHEKTCAGMGRSNARLTWHSKYDMKDWCGDAYKDLINMFNDQFTLMAQIKGAKPGSDLRFRITPWAMVQRQGDYATPHTHTNCHFSSCYYVDPGKQPGKYPESGNLEFFDPRGAVGSMSFPGLQFNGRHMYEPKAGLMVTFPAWLSHMVHPSTGGGERIAIAANAAIIKYEPKEA